MSEGGMSNNFTVDRTHRIGFDDFVSIVTCATGNVKPYDLPQNEEYRMEARVVVKFWANRAEFPDAQRIALHAIYAGIYAEVMQFLPRLRLAISDGSKSDAFRICDLMESVMRKPVSERPVPHD